MLIKKEESLLIVIDVQEYFLQKLEPQNRAEVESRIGWLIRVAALLDVPIVVTAEDIERFGAGSEEILDALPANTAVHNKFHFGLAGQADILAAVAATGRKTAVLIGLETDVCVAQSALGLKEQGYRVIVIADATASPGTGHAFGLARLQANSVELLSLKELYYDWMQTVPFNNAFEKAHLKAIGKPLGIIL